MLKPDMEIEILPLMRPVPQEEIDLLEGKQYFKSRVIWNSIALFRPVKLARQRRAPAQPSLGNTRNTYESRLPIRRYAGALRNNCRFCKSHFLRVF